MITNQMLRDLYLEDLKNPDIHHGRTTPKVRNPQHWADIKSLYKTVPDNVHYLDLWQLTVDKPDIDVWCWSDIHWGHKNIIKYAEGYRPYNSVEEMDAALIANYKAKVKPDDIVIFGGDIGFKAEGVINEILDDLPGYKIHIVGNHDIHRDGKVYKLHMDEQHVSLVVKCLDLNLLFTHYPMDKVPKMCVNVHGHIHQNKANAWNLNMCVEHTGCAPKNILDFVDEAEIYLESGQ